MRALARVMRCSMALSPTRKARAICAHGQAGDDAQRERDLLRRRQVRMAADEEQAQHVVAIMRAVEPLGDRRSRCRSRSEISSSGGSGCCLLRACATSSMRDVAADEDQPGRRIARRAVLRPAASAPAGRLPERPPRPCRDRGNSAAARRSPGAARSSARRRSRRGRSRSTRSPAGRASTGRIS